MVFDIIVLGVLVLSAIIACLRGFIREVLTIMGVVGGTLAAFAGGPLLSPHVLRWIGGDAKPEAGAEAEKIFGVVPPALMADLLAYGSIFIVVVIVLSIVSHFLSGWARSVGLGAVDRTFGVLFGLARGAVMLVLLYLPVYLIFDQETRHAWFENRTLEDGTETTDGSRTHRYVESAAGWLSGFIPENATDDLKKKAEKNAEKIAEDARARLLGVDSMDGAPVPAPADAEMPAFSSGPAGDEGYPREERRDLNELIMDNVDE